LEGFPAEQRVDLAPGLDGRPGQGEIGIRWTGVGEVSVPSAAPALTNAIAALTGTRVRQLPIDDTVKVA
jgi:hypothetical protein